jgi:heat shock protein HtpX
MISAYSVQRKNIAKTALLISVFFVLMIAVFYTLGLVFRSSIFIWIGIALAVGQSLIGYFAGDKIALASVGAKEVSESESPQLHEMISNLARTAGIPKPKIYISPDQSPNAFATGRDPKHAHICFNQGILDILDRSELEGVAAHELAHVKNRDILVMTMVSVMAAIIGTIIDLSTRFAFFGGASDENGNSSPFSIVFLIALALLVPLLSVLIQMGVSRSREYLADSSGAVLTRYPEGLARALLKLENSPVPSATQNTAMNHFYIVEPKANWGKKVKTLFSTHPPIEDRVEALRKMA